MGECAEVLKEKFEVLPYTEKDILSIIRAGVNGNHCLDVVQIANGLTLKYGMDFYHGSETCSNGRCLEFNDEGNRLCSVVETMYRDGFLGRDISPLCNECKDSQLPLVKFFIAKKY